MGVLCDHLHDEFVAGLIYQIFFLKTLMILGFYKKMVELNWSGWVETNSHSTPNSEIMNNLLCYQ